MKAKGDWVNTTTGALCEYITSGSRDWRSYYAESGAIFVRTQDINKDRLDLSNVAFVKLPELVEGKRSRLQPGDLLVTITGANVGKVAIVPSDIPEAYVSQSVGLMRLKDKRNAPFLHQYLQSERTGRKHLLGLVYGIGRPVLSLQNLREVPVQLPPLDEQRRIVAEIEKQFTHLDAGVAALRRTHANLKRYRAAVLKAACEGRLVPIEAELANRQSPKRGSISRKDGATDFESGAAFLERVLTERRQKWRGSGEFKEPVPPNAALLPPLSEGWTWATMPQLGELNRGKSKHRPRDDDQLYGGPYPFIQTGDIRRSGGTIREHAQTYSEFGLKQSRLWPEGTLCITIAANIAETGILKFRSCFPDSVVGFTHDGNPATTRYVEFFIRTAKEKLAQFAPATAQKNINLDVLQKVAVPLPPLAEQMRIVAEIERRLSVVEDLEAVVHANLQRATRLRQSVLQQAFNGQLAS